MRRDLTMAIFCCRLVPLIARASVLIAWFRPDLCKRFVSMMRG
jgi:hypothetical protein